MQAKSGCFPTHTSSSFLLQAHHCPIHRTTRATSIAPWPSDSQRNCPAPLPDTDVPWHLPPHTSLFSSSSPFFTEAAGQTAPQHCWSFLRTGLKRARFNQVCLTTFKINKGKVTLSSLIQKPVSEEPDFPEKKEAELDELGEEAHGYHKTYILSPVYLLLFIYFPIFLY